MAGDWIKMRGNLWDDPRVARLCDLTDQAEAAIVGGLYWLWATADQHTENGIMPGLTLRQIDRKTGIQGFGQSLCDIGWLEDHPDGVRIANFEEHNGTSAKRRSADAQRKATVRNVSASDADKTRTEHGQDATDRGAREEKRREEKKNTKEKKSAAAPIPRPDDVSEQVWEDWLQLRKKKSAPVTVTVLSEAIAEANKAGLPLERFLSIWCARGSQGLQADWLKPNERAGATTANTNKYAAAAKTIFGNDSADERRTIDA